MRCTDRSRLPVLVVLGLLLSAAGLRAQEAYDLILKGGHVIDPKNGRDAVMDVAIKNGKIAKVAPNISTELTWNIVPLKGLYVVPGLVDIHVHVYASSGVLNSFAGENSVYPDGFTFRSGVTTAVDAGCAGHRTFADFKRHIIDRSRTRILAWVNIVGSGMNGAVEQDPEEMDAKAAAAVVKKFPKEVVGIKTAHFGGPEWVAVERSLEAGTLAGVPIMVDFGTFREERPYQQLVTEKLRPGDVSTHLYKRITPFVDERGELLPYLEQARRRSVKFDVGHGSGSFSWKSAVPAVRKGFLPDSISTDLHVPSMNSGMKDMSNVMSKFLSLDVPLAKVIELSTSNPAAIINHPELGHLSDGAGADVAVFAVRTGQFGFLDMHNFRLDGKYKLECELTLRDGRVVWDLNGRAGFRFREPSRERASK